MANHTKSNTVHTLAECGMLLAISTVLAFFPTFEIMQNGGSITLCSMLPIVLISYRHGLGWGLLSGFAFSLIQIIEELTVNGIDAGTIAISFLFDYFLAFTVLGLGGIFRGKMKNPTAELCCGTVVALTLRYICHCISGYVLWGSDAEWFFSELGSFGNSILNTFSGNALSLVYTLVYNATYMLPELVLTTFAAFVLSRALPELTKQDA